GTGQLVLHESQLSHRERYLFEGLCKKLQLDTETSITIALAVANGIVVIVGVFCTTPQKGIVRDEIAETHGGLVARCRN
ncbi:MAG: hypothetical protein AAGE59_36070, partial [Cyanobacteria bacterium P01_F01_bin.86]